LYLARERPGGVKERVSDSLKTAIRGNNYGICKAGVLLRSRKEVIQGADGPSIGIVGGVGLLGMLVGERMRHELDQGEDDFRQGKEER